MKENITRCRQVNIERQFNMNINRGMNLLNINKKNFDHNNNNNLTKYSSNIMSTTSLINFSKIISL